MIKTRGWQISPAELEAQLILHPSIADAAVIGIPSPTGDTELPRAYVVKAADAEFSEEEIKSYMAIHLAKYKALEGGVKTIDEIPKNATGKILRNELKQRAVAEDAEKKELTITITPVVKHHYYSSTPQSAKSLTSTSSESDFHRGTSASITVSPATEISGNSDADDEAEDGVSALTNEYAKTELNKSNH